MFDDVGEFHKVILHVAQPESPTLISADFVLERYRFLSEELDEYFEAGMHGDIVKATDGLLDIVYVALGTLYMMGIPADECWAHVQKANMQKVLGMTSRGNKIDAQKPEGWVPPDIAIAATIERLIK